MHCQETTEEAGNRLARTVSAQPVSPVLEVAARMWVHEVVTTLEREVVPRRRRLGVLKDAQPL